MATKIPTKLIQSKKLTGKKAGYNTRDYWANKGVGDDSKPKKRQLTRLMKQESALEQHHESKQLKE